MLIESGPDHIKRVTGKSQEEINTTTAKKRAATKKKREEEAKAKPGYQSPSGSTNKQA